MRKKDAAPFHVVSDVASAFRGASVVRTTTGQSSTLFRPSRICLAITLAVMEWSACAQTVTAVTDGQWDTPGTWSNNAAPSSGNGYVVGNGFVVSSPPTGGNSSQNPFNGNSLTIQGGGTLQMVSDSVATSATPTFTIPGLTLESGATLSLVQTGQGNVNRTLTTGLGLPASGSVLINNTAYSNSYNNSLTLGPDAVLSGGADIMLDFNATGQSGFRKFLSVSSANNPYSGNWYVTSTGISAGSRLGGLKASAVNALGTGHVTLASSFLTNEVDGGLDSLSGVSVGVNSLVQVQANWNNPVATLTLTDPTAKVTVSGDNTLMNIGNLNGVAGSSITGSDADESLGVNITSDSQYAGVIAGNLSLVKSGAATLALTGTNTYNGGTTVTGGLVNFQSLSNFGSGNITLNGGGLQWASGVTVDVSSRLNPLGQNGAIFDTNGNDVTLASVLSGTGGVLIKQGAGILALTADNTYDGATQINNGTLQLGNGGSSGSIAGPVVDNGSLVVDRSNTLTLASPISGSGSLTQLGTGTTVLTGNNTYTGGTTISAGTLQIGDGGTTGSIVGNITNNGTLAFNRAGTLTYASVISGTGALVQMGPGTLDLYGPQTYTGPTIAQGGVLEVNGSIQSPTTVMAGGTLAGFGTITGNVQNFGTVWPGNAVAGDTKFGTLTIDGNYTGNRGILALNTYLGGDGSPSDKLVIDPGTATGNTGVVVHNTGGPGAGTQGDGILVVSATNGSTTAPNAFSLVGEVRGGAVDYRLYRGGLNGSNPENWYLRSTFEITPPCCGPLPQPEPPVTGPLPVDPPPEPLPPGEYPVIGPELATYGVVQPIARDLGMQMLGTLHERIGDSALIDIMPDTADHGPSVWGRTFASYEDNHYRAFADPRTQGVLSGFQVGVDVWRGALLPGQSDRAGFYTGYGYASMSVHGLVTNADATNYVVERTGNVNLGAWTLGGYWTHYGPGGWYVDAVLQGIGYDGSASTSSAHLDVTGTGFITSLEAGYPFAIPQLGSSFVLEPQVQAVWQRVALDQQNDGEGNVDLGTTTGTSGRVGIRGKWAFTRAGDERWEPYVVANLWHDWGAKSTVVYSGADQVPLEQEGSRLQLGAGITVKAKDRLSFYASVGYQFAVGHTDGDRRESIQAAVGLRKTW